MATHSSVLAWRTPGTGEPGGLLSMGSHRVGHDWSNLAAAAAAEGVKLNSQCGWGRWEEGRRKVRWERKRGEGGEMSKVWVLCDDTPFRSTRCSTLSSQKAWEEWISWAAGEESLACSKTEKTYRCKNLSTGPQSRSWASILGEIGTWSKFNQMLEEHRATTDIFSPTKQQLLLIKEQLNLNPLNLREGKHLICPWTLHRIKAKPHGSSSNLLCVPGPEVENLN